MPSKLMYLTFLSQLTVSGVAGNSQTVHKSVEAAIYFNSEKYGFPRRMVEMNAREIPNLLVISSVTLTLARVSVIKTML